MDSLFSTLEEQLKPELPTLTEAQKQLLQETKIDENQPGTILQDFQVMIDYLQQKAIEVSGVNHLLPLKIVSEFNSRLSRPIDVQLKRPVQKSYPYINGLYLLLRCSGITQIKKQGKKQLLVLDEEILASWSNLNPTEKYFNLLETWLLQANSEILGEQRDSFSDLFRCIQFWTRVPDKGIKFAKYEHQQDMSYFPRFYNIGLLDLFGFITIKNGKTAAGKGWRIASIQRLPFGDAILKLIYIYAIKEELSIDGDAADIEANISLGKLQPYFQEYFPEWQNNITIPPTEFIDGVYIFKVSLDKAWRRISIPAKQKLSLLAAVILDAFDFDNDHLYEFSYKSRFGKTITIHHPYTERTPMVNKVKIGDLNLQAGTTMTYLFDFGDNWKFNVELEAIDPPDSKNKKAKILEVHGKAPKQYYDQDDDWDENEEE
ncbi:MAG TPA: plasmid pRiA4b ORF-3 family protein [Nostocaceae cyanobacterium]|nr:plasmid pRiA4b ORF-3 family protein [Nostocaceae cyanobacterium]